MSDDEKDEKATPAARPSSATSRARRIGGGTAGRARPSAGPADDTSARTAAKTAAKPAAKASGKPTVALGKTGTAKRSGAALPAPPRSGSGPARDDRTVQVTVPAWVAWVPAAAFLVAAVAVLAFFVADRVGGSESNEVSQKERQTVLASAKTCVAAMNTYKYNALDDYERAGARCTTGRLTSQFRNTVDTLIRKAAPSQKFTQTAQINLAGVEDVSKNGKQWTVLVYGQLNITNKGTGKEGRVDPFSVVATMEKHDSRWVISRVRLLSSVGD